MAEEGDSFGYFTLGRRLGRGRSRTVYACREHRNLVIKVPHDGCGGANVREAEKYQKYGSKPHPSGVRFARCALLHNGWLVMERVKPLAEPNGGRLTKRRLPGWTAAVDCEQVGLNKKKQVVAFDYGDRLLE